MDDRKPAWSPSNEYGTADAEGASTQKTVLIVEDNEFNMKLFRDVLKAHGYQTLQAFDGLQAVKMARQSQPDLILMDIQLPKISGLEAAKRIKKYPSLTSVPIIAVTAFAMKGDEERILQGGCDGYIAKPISAPQFMEIVERFLN